MTHVPPRSRPAYQTCTRLLPALKAPDFALTWVVGGVVLGDSTQALKCLLALYSASVVVAVVLVVAVAFGSPERSG